MNMAARRPVAQVREMPVRVALEWAFAVERAMIDWPDGETATERAARRLSRSTSAFGQDVELGTKVDTSRGHTGHAAHAAELIAATVARIPRSKGGRAMAYVVVECARARSAPDTMNGITPRLEPRAWHQNQNGRRAATESLGFVIVQKRSAKKKALTKFDQRYCPLVLRPAPAMIAARRRIYCAWRGALVWLADELRPALANEGIAITDELPAERPWAPLAPGWERLIEAAG